MSHVTHMKAACFTYESVMSQTVAADGTVKIEQGNTRSEYIKFTDTAGVPENIYTHTSSLSPFLSPSFSLSLSLSLSLFLFFFPPPLSRSLTFFPSHTHTLSLSRTRTGKAASCGS